MAVLQVQHQEVLQPVLPVEVTIQEVAAEAAIHQEVVEVIPVVPVVVAALHVVVVAVVLHVVVVAVVAIEDSL